MNNRRYLPLIGIVTIFTTLNFILSACAGGSPSVSGPAAPIASVSAAPTTGVLASQSTSAPALVAGGDCSNPIMPVVAGASWNYNLTGDGTNMTITQTISTVSAAGFNDQYVINVSGVGASTQNGNWQCSQGTLTNLTPWSAALRILRVLVRRLLIKQPPWMALPCLPLPPPVIPGSRLMASQSLRPRIASLFRSMKMSVRIATSSG